MQHKWTSKSLSGDRIEYTLTTLFATYTIIESWDGSISGEVSKNGKVETLFRGNQGREGILFTSDFSNPLSISRRSFLRVDDAKQICIDHNEWYTKVKFEGSAMPCSNTCIACPFSLSEESEIASGCLPSAYEIMRYKKLNNENWSCHEDVNKICTGFVQEAKALGLDYKSGELTGDKYL